MNSQQLREYQFATHSYYVIHDTDAPYPAEFLSILRVAGVTTVRLPAKSPNLNAHAERFVRSITEEALHRVVPLGERHLRSVIREYIAHNHQE